MNREHAKRVLDYQTSLASPKTDVFRVSHSKISTWLRCKYAYHCRYVEKLRRKKKSRALSFGGIVHEMIEAFANGDDPFEKLDDIEAERGKLFKADVEEYGDIIQDVRVIMTDYFNYWDEKSLVYTRRKGSASEHKFEITLKDGVTLVGKIDNLGRTPNKLRWIVERKTFSQMPNDDHRWRSNQSAIYTRVNDILGWTPVSGTLWDYIWSKPPSEPQFKKDGEMSKRQILTLPSKVALTLEEHNLDPKKFGFLIKGAEENRAKWFQRVFSPTKRRVVDLLWAELMETTEEMVELHGKRKARNIGRHCDWCDYEAICRAALQGSDVDFVKEREFYVDKEDHSAEWDEAATGEA